MTATLSAGVRGRVAQNGGVSVNAYALLAC